MTTRGDRTLRSAALTVVLLGAVLLAGVIEAMPASAASCASCKPWWHLASSPAPTNLPPGEPPAGTETVIAVTAANLGDAPVKASPTEPVTITDKLPPHIRLTGENPDSCGTGAVAGQHMCGQTQPFNHPLTCHPEAGGNPEIASCDLTEELTPYQSIVMYMHVKVEYAPGTSVSLPNEVRIEGGNAKAVAVTRTLKVSEETTPFGVENFESVAEDEAGSVEAQAGAHPFQFTTTVALNESVFDYPTGRNQGPRPITPAPLRNLQVNLPPGLIGNATEIPQCTELEFTTHPGIDNNTCPNESAVGVAVVRITEPANVGTKTFDVPVFNLEPSEGEPARFGLQAFNVPVTLDTAVREGDYHVVVGAADTTQEASLLSSEITIWGVPGDASHDAERGWSCLPGPGEHGLEPCAPLSQEPPPPPFLTLPTSCTGPLQTTVTAESWLPGSIPTNPLAPLYTGEAAGTESLMGCGSLPFNPEMSVTTERQEASTPTGVTVDLKVPQATTLEAGGLAESDIRNTTVKFPVGIQLSPSAADGLASCSEKEIGFRNERTYGEGDVFEFSAGPAEKSTQAEEEQAASGVESVGCPRASKIGTVHVRTPLIKHELEGSIYLAAQEKGNPADPRDKNPFHSLFAIYIAVEDKETGVEVKLAGKTELDPTTGQVTTIFPNAPQLLFEDFKVELNGGPRASLASPRACGSYVSQASFSPWSGTATLEEPLGSFEINTGPQGTPCPSPSSG